MPAPCCWRCSLMCPVSLATLLFGCDLRVDLMQVIDLPMFWVKWAFSLCIAVAAFLIVHRLGRLGVRVRQACWGGVGCSDDPYPVRDEMSLASNPFVVKSAIRFWAACNGHGIQASEPSSSTQTKVRTPGFWFFCRRGFATDAQRHATF